MASRFCQVILLVSIFCSGYAFAESETNDVKQPITTSACISEKISTPELDNCKVWKIKSSDGNIRNLVARWSKEINWQNPVWNVAQDIPIDSDSEIKGNFETALGILAESLIESDTPIQFTLYANRVLRIEPYINTSNNFNQSFVEAR